MTIEPKVNFYYQHRHGGVYIVNSIASSTVDKSSWVVYNHVYPFDYQTWIRPYDEFVDGRFRELTRDEFKELLKKDRAAFQQEINSTREASKRDK